VQLLLVRSSSFSLAMTEPRAGGGVLVVVCTRVLLADGDRRTAPVFAARSRLCIGLAVCFGATTVTLGSAAPDAVCDIAGRPKPNSNAIDRMATAEGATKLDSLMARSSEIRGGYAFYLLSASEVQYHQPSLGFQPRK
jgi:hypothetical protein